MANFKQTEIGLIPEDWEVVRLGEVAEVKGGKRLPKGHKLVNYDTGFPYIRVIDFKNMSVNLSSVKFLEPNTYEKIKHYTISSNDVYISIAGTPGLIGVIPEILDNANLTENAAKLVLRSKNLIKWYLAYFLSSEFGQRQINQSIHKANQPKLALARIKTFKLPLPPLSEQQKIAKVLNKIQQAIEIQERIIQETKNLKKSLMKKLFTEGLYDEEPKETEIGIIPKSWEVVKLGDGILKNISYGLSIRGKNKGKYPILRMNNLVDGLISTKDLQFVDIDEKTFRKFKLYIGDILFNRTNSFELVGKTSIFTFEGDFVFASYLIRIKVNESIIDPFYFNFYFNWNKTQTRLKGLASRGVNQANISATKLKSFPIPLPPLEEQKEIAHILSTVDKKIEIEKKKKEILKELFKTMLHKLMSGEIRLKEIEV